MAHNRKKEVRDADDVVRNYVEGEMARKSEEQTEVDREFESARNAAPDTRRGVARRKKLRRPSSALTGGDIDAAADTADAVGEETVGGSNPTPDQDIVDDLGKGAGVTYEDNEPLKLEDKMENRDANRWELDPASSEDYEDRQREEP